VSQNPTFGCGAFLPGEGPGNFPQFVGGGVIETGGGDGTTPPDPPVPADPPIQIKTCVCLPNTSSPISETITFPSPRVAIITRVYSQTCTEFANSDAASIATANALSQLLTQDPPAGEGWSAAAPPQVNGGPIGQDCKSPDGTCGAACPNITVVTRWRQRLDPGSPITGTSTGPGGATFDQTPDDQLPCGCVVDSLEPRSVVSLGVDAEGCESFEAKWTYTCKKERPNNPLVGQNPYTTWNPTPSPGGAVSNIVREGGSGVCKKNTAGRCSGQCGPAYVRWKDCPGSPGGPGGTSIGSQDNIANGFIFGGETDDDDGGGNPGGPGGTSIGSQQNAGNGLILDDSIDDTQLNDAINLQNINLNNPDVIREILKLKPNGIQDSELEFRRNPEAGNLVDNDTQFTALFNTRIDSNIHYVLKNIKNITNWDSTKSAGVTYDSVINSLKPEIKNLLDDIRNYDGTMLTQNQIFSMIGSRILDGTIGEVTIGFLQKLAEDSQRRVPTTITRSTINKVNEIAALIFIDRHKIPLDVSKISGIEAQEYKNFRILSSDVDKFIPVTIEGITRRFYINDDDTFIDRSTLSIQDGDYFDVVSGGRTTRLFVGSEKDHAFLVPEDIRQKALTLLGGNPGRSLSVSGDKETASGIEYDSSLSSPRQPFYVLSAVVSSVETSPSEGGSFLLKDTSIRYQLMDTSTAAGLDATNKFIKYKPNKRIFILDHQDLIIDYMEHTGSVNLKQTDILFDSPKTNKTIPLLVRQIPFYIMIYPTNRSEYNIFNDKSRIVEIGKDGSISRELRCKTHINPEFTVNRTNKFIKYKTDGRDAVDVLGIPDTQTRISFIDADDEIFKTGFKKGNTFVPPSEYDVDREKTGFRVIREIINELDTNYELSINGVGKTLTEFDAFSRLTLKQYNILSRLENFDEIDKAVSNGFVNDVKLIPPIENADTRIVINKTQLVQRKSTAGTDTFKPIKSTNDGRDIISPDEKGVGGFGPST